MLRYAYIAPGGFPTVENIDAFWHTTSTVYRKWLFAMEILPAAAPARRRWWIRSGKRTGHIRATITNLEEIELDDDQRAAIFRGNARLLLDMSLTDPSTSRGLRRQDRGGVLSGPVFCTDKGEDGYSGHDRTTVSREH
jgi:hypothetical protein